VDALASIIDEKTSEPAYFLTYRVLNTKGVGGLPQHREHTYIVGILKSAMRRQLKWPSGYPAMPLSSILAGKVVDPPEIPTLMTEQRN
jgi:site-specific DNA-cytosine methylase